MMSFGVVSKKQLWYTEPSFGTGRTLVLEVKGRRFICPMVNSVEWSIDALKDLAGVK